MQLAFLSLLATVVSVVVLPEMAYVGTKIAIKGGCLRPESDSDGALVRVYSPCQDTDLWRIDDQAGTIKWKAVGAAAPDRCLDVPSGNDVDGNKLQIWTCGAGNLNQKWTFPAGPERIQWANHNKCVDLDTGILGNQAQIWTCQSGNANQITDYPYP
ncbi:hypothetical protein CPB86DRAFT_786120 [Serendipita vermifera]|nr:hypothetical protein CPB86DRAFT_786120 [Serendipita vermifera]